MKYLLVLPLLVASCLPVNGPDSLGPEDQRILLEDVLDATVVVGHERADGPGYDFHCSGAVVGQVVLTANHCVQRWLGQNDGWYGGVRDDIGVAFRAEELVYHPARVIAHIPEQDIAVLQLARGLPRGFRVARVPPVYGQKVAVIGHPWGLFWTYDTGIVTFPRRVGGMTGVQVWMQHDADTDPGDSGGPMMNANGELLGIVSFGIGRQEGAVHLSQVLAALALVGLDPDTLR